MTMLWNQNFSRSPPILDLAAMHVEHDAFGWGVDEEVTSDRVPQRNALTVLLILLSNDRVDLQQILRAHAME